MKKEAVFAALFVVLAMVAGVALSVDSTTALQPTGPISGAQTVAFHDWSPQDPAYEGDRTGCRRCHLAEHRAWSRTAHANTFETLPEESRTDSSCLRCHTTGYGEPSGFTSIEETPELAKVGCEVCHGPGSLYKDEDTMKSRDASVAAGLLLPDESTCTACHNADSPTFPGSFDYEAMKEAGIHPARR